MNLFLFLFPFSSILFYLFLSSSLSFSLLFHHIFYIFFFFLTILIPPFSLRFGLFSGAHLVSPRFRYRVLRPVNPLSVSASLSDRYTRFFNLIRFFRSVSIYLYIDQERSPLFPPQHPLALHPPKHYDFSQSSLIYIFYSLLRRLN